MSDKPRLEFESLVNFDASTLTGTYQAINGSGTSNPLKMFKFYNSSSNLVIISYDGVNDEDFIPPGGMFVLDIQTNSAGIENADGKKQLRQGTVVYAKTSSDTDRLIMAGYY